MTRWKDHFVELLNKNEDEPTAKIAELVDSKEPNHLVLKKLK